MTKTRNSELLRMADVCYENQNKDGTFKDRECLALVVAIKQFHVYLANNKFHVYTDHIALQYLHRLKESTGRLARWSMYLQTYNFEVHYQPGKDNVCADFLSRIQHPENQRQRRLSIDEIEVTLYSNRSIQKRNQSTKFSHPASPVRTLRRIKT
ncbi:Hypothetical predicted protein [Mytilus galloprovincialis]|uniref:Reverse transcriptase RNase H-like domain-containing protein n=1 Tax=Mytilus galloprovincialis TaxID=29158 RepID=A0A8B6GCI6_MYTGA|nr:Hypothetical predicted protein [Mytilus galloprovincialis]